MNVNALPPLLSTPSPKGSAPADTGPRIPQNQGTGSHTTKDGFDRLESTSTPGSVPLPNHFSQVLTAHLLKEPYEESVSAAIRAVIPNSNHLSEDELYAALNSKLDQMTPAKRARFLQSAFEATTSAPAGRKAKGEFSLSGFIGRLFSIQKGGIVGPTHIKPAHKDGVSGVVKVTVQGDAPANLAGIQHAVARLGPGGAGAMPGLAVALMGEGQNQSRVFISLKGDSFEETLSTDALGITTAGPEGSLTFFPSPTLGKLKLKKDSEASHHWMSQAAKFPPGTALGTLLPNKEANWSIELTTDGPLSSNLFGDRNLRFKRNLGFSTWYTGLAWVITALATSFITVPLAIGYGIYRLLRGAFGPSSS